MKRAFLWLTLASSVCHAQKICLIPKRGPSVDVVSAFEKIQDAVGIEPGTILLYASSDPLVKERSGAVSVECPAGGGNERWIVYDPELIKGDGLYFALAHETAHHVNNDPMSGEPPSKQQELRADGYAARYLARPPLNWTSQGLAQAMNALPIRNEAPGVYPSLEERRTRANADYAAEYARLHPEPPPGRPAVSASQPAAVQPVSNGLVLPRSLTAGETRTSPKDGLTYVWIPQGNFRMGCSRGDNECLSSEEAAHEVIITKGFWIGQTEVTQAAYQKVMNGQDPSGFKGVKLPVENISWNDANAYCRAVGGRLPTEAEWEYAGRAGSTDGRYGDLDQIAWYDKNSGHKTHEVAGKAPNAWGLYDMLGNVWEWTADWYADKLPAATTDPKGPFSGQERVLRGGSWVMNPPDTRVSRRFLFEPDVRYNSIGVRCVTDLP